MAEPTVFEKIKRDDYSVLPYEANKFYSIQAPHLESLGYTFKKGYYYKGSLEISSSKNFVKTAATSSDGSFNYLNWKSIRHLYYRNPFNPAESFEGHIQQYTEKNLFLTASIISAPYFDMGEGFKKGSVAITGSNLRFLDDGDYNLYDDTLSADNLSNSNFLDAYLGFQNIYEQTRVGFSPRISKKFKFISNTIGDETVFRTKNVTLSSGIPVNGTGSGAQIDFIGPSYIEIPHYEELSYEKFEDFSISFWLKTPVSQSVTSSFENSILTKRSYTNLQELSQVDTLLESGANVKRTIVSSSLKYIPSDYYPYDFSIYNQTAGADSGKIIFRRSDSSNTLTLTGSLSINDGNYHHICVTKYNDVLSLYVDGTFESSGSEVIEQPTNGHSIILGSEDYNGTQQFSGSLDELRFYSYAVNSQQVSQSLSDNTTGLLYQTRNIGNVFYRRGEVVITSPIRKYHDILEKRLWEFQYRNRYTIYEYETLVRIRRGMFNKTMNPSSTQSPKSNLYLNDFTGSLSPYVTTVGLYNKDFQLVAVGKLGRPLKMRDDVDINIIVRWDY